MYLTYRTFTTFKTVNDRNLNREHNVYCFATYTFQTKYGEETICLNVLYILIDIDVMDIDNRYR